MDFYTYLFTETKDQLGFGMIRCRVCGGLTFRQRKFQSIILKYIFQFQSFLN